ncbi:hypothetical protein KR222_002844, partial [Zaprionus bogoriensis]
SEVRRSLLEVASCRPNTNVSKAIVAYSEAPSLSALLLLLEEISKNTDFSTDMRISLAYVSSRSLEHRFDNALFIRFSLVCLQYMDEFLRQTSSPKVLRRSVIAAAGNVLQCCSKIYGDRVELMYQAVENQIEALLIADPKKDEQNSTNNGAKEAKKPEEPRKRRCKKLTQKEFDPFAYIMEVKKFKTMSDEKRFSRAGFETNRHRNRTIEHMYQDHTPAKLWTHAPIIDPANPYEKDEKKNYKLFTYHPEPRYNTLLPDISFERLHLIKEYVKTNQVDVSDTLNENVSNKEYLDEYIALENQMLASRYGEISRKRSQNCRAETSLENLQKRLLAQSEESAKRMRLTEEPEDQKEQQQDFEDTDMQVDADADEQAVSAEGKTLETQISVDSALGDTLKNLTLGDTLQDDLNDSQIKASALSSTMVGNDSAADSAKDRFKEDDQQLDSGIQLDDLTEALRTAQSFDDEGVVLPDNVDEQRLQSLSPKVMVRDILPGVPDKANLSVLVDAEMLALSGIKETLEEVVNVPRDVRYPIVLNILHLPHIRLRKSCLFKLPKDFELFKQTVSGSEIGTRILFYMHYVMSCPKIVYSLVAIASEAPSRAEEACCSANFGLSIAGPFGFRRPTYDSGIDYEELRGDSANLPVDENSIVDVGTEELPYTSEMQEEIPQVRAEGALDEREENSMREIPMDTMNETIVDNSAPSITALNETSLNDELTMDTPALNETAPEEALALDAAVLAPQLQDGHDETQLELGESGLDRDTTADDSLDEESLNASKNGFSIDEETEAKIIDWHRRLAPMLEAAHARQNFSIQDLNDEIIQKCQEKNGQASLADVVEDKDPTKLCCYMLSSLLLTNQGNVALQIGKHDKSKPLEVHQVRMKLLSTERKQLNPEDDIGNIRSSKKEPEKPRKPEPVKAIRRKAPISEDDKLVPLNVKTVRLIAPMPKASARPEDADSGISSLATS